MSCCGSTIVCDDAVNRYDRVSAENLVRLGHSLPDGTVQYIASVPGIHCGACIAAIERELQQLAGVASVRVNLTLKQVSVVLDSLDVTPTGFINRLEKIGYPAHVLDHGEVSDDLKNNESRKLLIALSVAGFAATNIMLLSVSIWSGADGSTRDMFHLISALIALPAVAFSGQVFFRSALSALRNGRLNMDVPISLAVILALVMSLYETFTGGREAYFDAAVTLLFFLLIGRYLDHLMRDRARSAAMGLARYAAKGANLIRKDGTLAYLSIDEIEPGMHLRVNAGERFAVDGTIIKGQTDCDRSFVTGESNPVHLFKGDTIEAGVLNLTGPVDMEASRSADASFLGEVMKMMQAAENGRGHYVGIADRLARIYAPAVHIMAAVAFITWFTVSGDWHLSIYIAISVLIITCPCALGLAVPVVHVIAAGKLFENGILMKDGSALERLAEADLALFDKTGTLTTGLPTINDRDLSDIKDAAIAKTLAAHSLHPASRALTVALNGTGEIPAERIREVPGSGIEGVFNGKKARLGRAEWVAEIANAKSPFSNLSFAVEGGKIFQFPLAETLREGAVEAVRALEERGMDATILSGDNGVAVSSLAQALQITNWHHDMRPEDKSRFIQAAQAEDHRVLMVGDGLNDAPSLALAHVSMAPASASDIGRMASDFIFTRSSLTAVPFALSVATKARTLVKQNFMLALAYNCIAVPLAFAGLITPLFAAIAMSASSIVVVGNSLRLVENANRPRRENRRATSINQRPVGSGASGA